MKKKKEDKSYIVLKDFVDKYLHTEHRVSTTVQLSEERARELSALGYVKGMVEDMDWVKETVSEESMNEILTE